MAFGGADGGGGVVARRYRPITSVSGSSDFTCDVVSDVGQFNRCRTDDEPRGCIMCGRHSAEGSRQRAVRRKARENRAKGAVSPPRRSDSRAHSCARAPAAPSTRVIARRIAHDAWCMAHAACLVADVDWRHFLAGRAPVDTAAGRGALGVLHVERGCPLPHARVSACAPSDGDHGGHHGGDLEPARQAR